ncbi:MAG: DUF11 domain-containing protein [Candidatus Thermoplasmatota archaeon]|nr:DUF11 domain-containing protein [Candidatus Thermoplasmatota archaeon]
MSLPSQASFVSATAGCSHANALVTCSLSSLNNASNASFQVAVQPGAAATLDASASVSSAVYDPDGSNNFLHAGGRLGVAVALGMAGGRLVRRKAA